MGGYRACLRFPVVGAPRRTEEQAVKDSMPCKGCERRTVRPNCHATCEQYAEFVKNLDKDKRQLREDAVFHEYVKERTLKRR